MKRGWLISLLVTTILLVACGPATIPIPPTLTPLPPTHTLIPASPTPIPPTPMPAPPTPTSIPPSPTPYPYGSRQNPVLVGTTATTPNGWEITVIGFDSDAWPEVLAENQFNDPPWPGNRMVLIKVRVTNIAAGKPAQIGDFNFNLIGSYNHLYTTFDDESRRGVIPDGLGAEASQGVRLDKWGVQVWQGSSTEGNICFQLPVDETNLLLGFNNLYITGDQMGGGSSIGLFSVE